MLRYPPKCYTQYESNIGYYPRRTTQDTVLRYGPADDAPEKIRVRGGQRVGLQSVRNPGFSASPEPRGATNGYVWVFVLRGGESGWMRADHLRVDDPHSEPWADGPASADFEVGLGEPRPKRKPRFTIGWKPRSKTLQRDVVARDLYIRYAVKGTAFHFLLEGDVVELRWHHPMGFSCVKVIASRYCPPGTIGWVHRKGLSRG